MENELYDVISSNITKWDPDFIKLTKREADELAEAKQSGFVNADDIDWDAIGV